uniref:CASP-like protein n=1 Tax=Angiostrongylus cantonensis TaxID=6313 RepID=A0A0K0DJN8_ANGCA
MCCERTVATIRSNKYEDSGIALSLLLLALTIVGVVVAADYAYDTDHFNVKLWSMIYVPPGAEAKFNHVASLNIIICFVCIATFHVLSRFNKKQCSV